MVGTRTVGPGSDSDLLHALSLSVCVVGGANPQLVLTAVLISVGVLLLVVVTTAALLCYR